VKANVFSANQVWEQLIKLVPPSTQRVFIAYSGGIDSQVLLHALATAYQQQEIPPFRLEAMHIHHGLHPKADDWVTHCQSCCLQYNVPLTVAYVNPNDFPEHSPEAAAREARYQAFKAKLDKQDVLVLGHHLDDQLETLLQRLCRGTGVLGLAGMAVYQQDKWPFAVARPLLGLPVERTDVARYAKHNQLQWIEDDSNNNPRFDRNFMRHQIMPLLKSRWPKASFAAQRSAQLCREAADYCEAQARQYKAQVHYASQYSLNKSTAPAVEKSRLKEASIDRISEGESLSVKRLLAFSSERRRDIIRVWLQDKGFYSPSFAHLKRIEQEILGAVTGGRPRLKIREYVVARWRDRLFIYRATSDLVQ
jgi:tRNA(Ile)-lysidine synthase